jgi:hypothetical protein
MTKSSITFADRFPTPLAINDLCRAVADVAEHGSEESFHFTAGVAWVVDDAYEAGRITEDAALSMLMAVYENQGLDEISVPAEE